MVRGHVAGGNWFDFSVTGGGVNPRTFTVLPRSGYASVESGVTVTPPTPVVSPAPGVNNFSVDFTLRETTGFPITFAEVAAAILDEGGTTLFNLPIQSNVTVPARGTWTFPTQSGYLVNPGDYRAIVRGHVAGGNWFDFSVTGEGVNPRPFEVIESPGFVSVVSAPTALPSPAPLGQDFTVAFTLRELQGRPITFEQIALAILRQDGSTLFDLALYDQVTFGPGEARTFAPTGRIYPENQPGTYAAIVRGRVAGGNWFDFSTSGSAINPRSFEVEASAARVLLASGVSVQPVPVLLDEDFSATFTLQESNGVSAVFEEIQVVLLGVNSSVLTLASYSNQSFAPYASRPYSVTAQVPSQGGAYPPGTYALTVRGRVADGPWSVLPTTNAATNPRSVPVSLRGTQRGYAAVSQGVTVSPNVTIGQSFTGTFTLKETAGYAVTFQDIALAILRNGQTLFDLGVSNDVALGPGESRAFSHSGQIFTGNPGGTYQAVVRGRLPNGAWFDFTSTNGGLNPRSFAAYDPAVQGIRAHFDEAASRYGVPSSLLKAIGHVESSWNQASVGGTGYGVMQLEEASHTSIAQRLRQDFPADYGSLSDAQVAALLRENSDAGARANIRGGASKLRWDIDHISGLRFAGEPLEALETWWFTVANYNGGGADNDLRTTNYPYRVFNCFLNGINAQGGVRVPKIAVTLPPHFWFRKADDAEIAIGEVVDADAQLTPHAPRGFIRFTLPFDACRDLGYLHDSDGNLLSISGCDAVPLRLRFPLGGYDANNARINSVYDYSTPFPNYANDDWVVDYVGEAGERNFGSYLDGYKNRLGTNFDVNGSYTGAGAPAYLFYEGHPGYDYRATTGTSVYATGPGQFIIDRAPASNCGTLSRAHIDHGNGYSTYYLHCREFSLPDLRTITPAEAAAGIEIGKVGDKGSCGAPHLHLEVRKDGWAVDPYGWDGGGPRTWTAAVRSRLWAGAPAKLVANAASTGIGLSWAPTPGELAEVSSYNVYRGDSAAVTYVASVPGHTTEFSDIGVLPGNTYTYHITGIAGGVETPPSNEATATFVDGVTDVENGLVQGTTIRVYPNPFMKQLGVQLALSVETDVEVRIHDLSGRSIWRRGAERMGPGRHELVWEGRDGGGRDVPPGIYFCRIRLGRALATRKVLRLR
jgi:murein DD-endopeptidase MepM/ murein hydrolase activator NlpD